MSRLSEMNLDDVIDFLCSKEELDPPYVVDKEKQASYMEAIVELYKLKLDNKVNVVSIDDYEKAYGSHAIFFDWIKDKNGEWEVEANKLVNIFRNVDGLNVSNGSIAGEWQLTSTFYKKIN